MPLRPVSMPSASQRIAIGLATAVRNAIHNHRAGGMVAARAREAIITNNAA